MIFVIDKNQTTQEIDSSSFSNRTGQQIFNDVKLNAEKSHSPKLIKIQLGMKCNYSCAYCSQASQPDDQTDLTSKIPAFIEKLKELDLYQTKVELWGGEPFVYWKTLVPLVKALRENFSRIDLSLVTNGSLLNEEKVNWLRDNQFTVGISHDGPAQSLRGPDPLDKESTRNAWVYLLSEMPGKVAFNCVLTRQNYSVIAVRDYIAKRLDVSTRSINVSTEEIVSVYDNGSMSMGIESYEDYQNAIHTIFADAINGSIDLPAISYKVEDYIYSLRSERPVSSLWQKCGMDRPEYLAVNLDGEVHTCQNTSSEEHKIGTIGSAKLTTALVTKR
jgi:uncharacterized protein